MLTKVCNQLGNETFVFTSGNVSNERARSSAAFVQPL
jgi:hypothetical protein